MSATTTPAKPASGNPFSRVLRHSRFVQRALQADAALAEEVAFADFLPWDRDAMARFLVAQPLGDAERLARALRRLRAHVFVRLAVRDLAGMAPLAEVHATMSDLADVTIEAAHRFWTQALEADFGTPMAEGARQELIVIGMGKLGGRELNVSSDIDLIFVYPEEGETVGARTMANQEFFNRLGQRIIAALNEPTADGRVFRVDMRLRPWGDAGPLTTSFGALENYFLVHGREWERYAWIKARAITGAPATHAQLAQHVRPFVFRKYLDFGAIGALRALHAQIRQEVARRDLADHVKLGPGGIREIEFIAQAYQLIRAGRDRSLQIQPTLEVLRLLAIRNVLSPDTSRELVTAYTFLRRLEHRLQYLEDAQTHVLPADSADRALLAEAMGFADYGAFAQALAGMRAVVTRHFSATFSEPDDSAPANGPGSGLRAIWAETVEPEAALTALRTVGFRDAQAVLDQVRGVREGGRYRTLPASSQARLDNVIPRLLDCASRTALPDAALSRALRLVESVSRRSSYLALLDERRDALAKLTDLVAASSWAATYLSGHPILLDDLLDVRRTLAAPDPERFAVELREAMRAVEADTELQMDRMRELHHGQVFNLLLLDIEGSLTIERLADFLSALADAVLRVTIELTWARLNNRHRDTPRFAVVGYGKLGGKELGYASDLDLAFLYDDDDPAAAQNYARLAQRIVSWLSSRTSAGLLFDTDLRLRPDGEAGLLVTSMEAFKRYQRESAWPWEHQALTRARFCAGDPGIGADFEEERIHILTRQRDAGTLAREVVAMRRKMLDAHPNRSSEFDVKHDPGGMIDIEFIVQYLVLAYAHSHRTLTGNLGNIALLGIAAECGLIDAELARQCQDAYREFRRVQHRLRLNEAQYARVPPAQVQAHVQAAKALWQRVFEHCGA